MSCRGHRTVVFKSFHVFLRTNVALTSRLLHTKPRYSPSSTGPKIDTPNPTIRATANPWILYPGAALLLAGAGYVAYENYQPFRHALLAVVRCSRIARMCTYCSWYAADRRHAWFALLVNIHPFRCCNHRSYRLQVHFCSRLLVRGGKAARVFRVSRT